jgi:hypothetical protein
VAHTVTTVRLLSRPQIILFSLQTQEVAKAYKAVCTPEFYIFKKVSYPRPRNPVSGSWRRYPIPKVRLSQCPQLNQCQQAHVACQLWKRQPCLRSRSYFTCRGRKLRAYNLIVFARFVWGSAKLPDVFPCCRMAGGLLSWLTTAVSTKRVPEAARLRPESK